MKTFTFTLVLALLAALLLVAAAAEQAPHDADMAALFGQHR